MYLVFQMTVWIALLYLLLSWSSNSAGTKAINCLFMKCFPALASKHEAANRFKFPFRRHQYKSYELYKKYNHSLNGNWRQSICHCNRLASIQMETHPASSSCSFSERLFDANAYPVIWMFHWTAESAAALTTKINNVTLFLLVLRNSQEVCFQNTSHLAGTSSNYKVIIVICLLLNMKT